MRRAIATVRTWWGRLAGRDRVRERLSRWAVLEVLALSWLFAALAVGLLDAVFASAAYGDLEPEPARALPWRFPLGDAWGVVANAPLALAGLAVLTLLVRRGLGRRLGDATVALLPLAAILAATGALGTLASGEERAGRGVLAWLLAGVLVRRLPVRPVAAQPEPAGRWRRRARVALVALALLGLGALPPVAYARLHPLEVSDGPGCGSEDGCVVRERRRVETGIGVSNTGRTPVTITAVRFAGVAPGLRLERVRRVPDVGYARPLRLPVTLPLDGSLRLLAAWRARAGTCRLLAEARDDRLPAIARRLRVDYRVRGRGLTVELALSAPLRIRSCTGPGGVSADFGPAAP